MVVSEALQGISLRELVLERERETSTSPLAPDILRAMVGHNTGSCLFPNPSVRLGQLLGVKNDQTVCVVKLLKVIWAVVLSTSPEPVVMIQQCS